MSNQTFYKRSTLHLTFKAFCHNGILQTTGICSKKFPLIRPSYPSYASHQMFVHTILIKELDGDNPLKKGY